MKYWIQKKNHDDLPESAPSCQPLWSHQHTLVPSRRASCHSYQQSLSAVWSPRYCSMTTESLQWNIFTPSYMFPDEHFQISPPVRPSLSLLVWNSLTLQEVIHSPLGHVSQGPHLPASSPVDLYKMASSAQWRAAKQNISNSGMIPVIVSKCAESLVRTFGQKCGNEDHNLSVMHLCCSIVHLTEGRGRVWIFIYRSSLSNRLQVSKFTWHPHWL